MSSVKIACWSAALLLCSSANAQVREVDPQWVFVSQPIPWQCPPPEIGLQERTGPVELVVLYPPGEYGYVACYACYVIQQADRYIAKSAGEWSKGFRTCTSP